MQEYLKWLRMVPMILVMGTIFLLSHQPGDTLDLGQIPGSDKLAHLVVYGVLAATVLFAHQPGIRKSRPRRVAVSAALVCLVYGVADEWHQSFIPGRFVSVGDVVADVSGAILVAIAWYYRWRHQPAIRVAGTPRG
jgi:VanZ family protein